MLTATCHPCSHPQAAVAGHHLHGVRRDQRRAHHGGHRAAGLWGAGAAPGLGIAASGLPTQVCSPYPSSSWSLTHVAMHILSCCPTCCAALRPLSSGSTAAAAAGRVLHRGRHHLHAGAGVRWRPRLLPAGRAVSAAGWRRRRWCPRRGELCLQCCWAGGLDCMVAFARCCRLALLAAGHTCCSADRSSLPACPLCCRRWGPSGWMGAALIVASCLAAQLLGVEKEKEEGKEDDPPAARLKS